MISPFRTLAMLAGLSALFCCGSPTQQDKVEDANTEKLKPAAELSYLELWQLILEANDAMGEDVHGEVFGSEAVDSLTITTGGACSDIDCGEGVTLQNMSQQSIDAVVKFAFDIPGNPARDMSRIYRLTPEGTTSLGCSEFCYDGETYPITVSLTSAGFGGQ